MNLTAIDLRAALYCCAALIRSRQRTGEPIPQWLRRHHARLENQFLMSARGHQFSCETAESDTLSTMQVAEMLSRPERWVRRHRELLGAHKDGDRWRYPRAAVAEYAEGSAADA